MEVKADVGPDDVDILGELSKEDVIPDDKPEDKSEDKKELSKGDSLDVEVKEEPEEKTEEELEEELEAKKETDELEFEDIPKRQEILKEFPDFFKKFPSIEKVIYREQQYAEVFPTVEEAKSAMEEVNIFHRFQSDLSEGNISTLLRAVNEADSKAYNALVGNFLGTLKAIDTNAYFDTVNDVIKTALKGTYDMAKKNGDEQLEIATQLLHKFLYQTPEISGPKERRIEKSPEQEKFEKDRESFARRQQESAVNDVTNRINNIAKSWIERNIDPRNEMIPRLKAAAIDDALRMLDSSIASDTRFRQLISGKWEASAKADYSEQSKLDIRNALISKAKSVLPQIVRSVRANAMKGQATRTREASVKRDDRPVERGRPATSGKREKGKIPQGMSTMDYIMSDD